MSKPSLSQLEKALHDAGSAHHDYEQVILGGVRDELWAGFYAAYVLGRFDDFVASSTLCRWLEEAPGGDNWPATTASYVLSRLKDKRLE